MPYVYLPCHVTAPGTHPTLLPSTTDQLVAHTHSHTGICLTDARIAIPNLTVTVPPIGR